MHSAAWCITSFFSARPHNNINSRPMLGTSSACVQHLSSIYCVPDMRDSDAIQQPVFLCHHNRRPPCWMLTGMRLAYYEYICELHQRAYVVARSLSAALGLVSYSEQCCIARDAPPLLRILTHNPLGRVTQNGAG